MKTKKSEDPPRKQDRSMLTLLLMSTTTEPCTVISVKTMSSYWNKRLGPVATTFKIRTEKSVLSFSSTRFIDICASVIAKIGALGVPAESYNEKE